jgi:phosphonate transport system substrate-binding protein
VTLRFLVPPSVGAARAQARGELLETSLSRELGEAVTVSVADDYASLERAARAGDAELVWAPATLAAVLEPSARALFKSVRGGRSTYRSALVARTDAHVSLQNLAGKRAAWVDRLSFGGYLLVANHLRERGIDLDDVLASQSFVGTHPEALAAVLEGRADIAAVSVAGASEEDVAHALALHAGRGGANNLRALAVTRAIPTDALALTSELTSARAEALIERLFPRGGGRGHAASLALAMEVEGFERALPNEYNAIRELMAPRRAR